MSRRIQVVIIDNEPAVRTLVKARVEQLAALCGVDVDVVECAGVADAQPYVDAPLPQTPLEQSALQAGQDRLGQLLLLNGNLDDGTGSRSANELASKALLLGKHVVRITGDPHTIPSAVAGHGVVWKPIDMLVFTDYVARGMRHCLSM